jgi:hypothetical protein
MALAGAPLYQLMERVSMEYTRHFLRPHLAMSFLAWAAGTTSRWVGERVRVTLTQYKGVLIRRAGF